MFSESGHWIDCLDIASLVYIDEHSLQARAFR